MAKRKPPLGVWLYGVRVAELVAKGAGYDLAMRYSDEACLKWALNAPLLSCSLPLGPSRLNPTNYFRGLLPEGQHLQFLAAQANVTTSDVYGLLARYGRDVAGAVIVSLEDPEHRAGAAVPYDTDGLIEEIEGLDNRPLAVYDDSELSIPGLQKKLLLIETETGWARPTGGRPSTHIVKVEDRRFPGLVRMEHAAMTIARNIGIPAAETKVASFGDTDCLIVSRFDRVVDESGHLQRIHQEDMCQALGIDPFGHQGRAKYEGFGGPSFLQVAELLDRQAASPQIQLSELIRVLIFTTLIGDGDAHGKNLSLLHTEPGVVTLAPLYDIVPTVLWQKLSDRAAMHVNGVKVLSRVGLSDVKGEVAKWPVNVSVVAEVADEVIDGIRGCLDEAPFELAEVLHTRIEYFLGH